jgi:hypothetical protein
MADAIDAILGGDGGQDEIDAILGGGTPAAPGRAAIPGLVDMGPAARRARAGMAPGMRAASDDDVGARSGPVKGRTDWPHGVPGMQLGWFAEARSPAERQQAADAVQRLRREGTPEALEALPDKERDDAEQGAFLPLSIIAGTAGGAAGGAAGKVLAPVAKAVPKVAPLVPVAAAATGGAVAAKSVGGDPLLGAGLAAMVPAATGTMDAVERAAARGAPARVGARVERNLGENVNARTADKITAVAKKGALGDVLDRNPELREALAVQAAEKPAQALKPVKKRLGEAGSFRDDAVDRMQKFHADKPPSSQATISGILDEYDRLLDLNPADLDRHNVLSRARSEVAQLGDRLRRAQKLPPAEGDYSGTVVSPKDLRDLERTIGRRAYEMGTPMSVKRQVNAELYKPLARQMDALAKATPGVDAKKFAHAGQDIHVLTPVEEALEYLAKKENQGKPTIGERLTNVVHGVSHVPAALAGHAAGGAAGAVAGLIAPTVLRGAGRLAKKAGRRLDFQLAEKARRFGVPSVQLPSAVDVPASVAYAKSVSDAMRSGASLKEAVAAADAEHH